MISGTKVTFLGLISPSGCGMGVEWVCLGHGPCVPDVHQKKLAPMQPLQALA